MKDKNRKKIIICCYIIFFVIFLFFVVEIYARFKSAAAGVGAMEVAIWSIKVNDEDILNKSVLTEKVSFKVLNNIFTAEDKLAPSCQGYFDIVIDASATEVSSQYEIEIDEIALDLLNIKGFKLVGYEVNPLVVPDFIPTTLNTNLNIKRTILLNESNPSLQKETIRIYGEWNDDLESDIEHTDTGINILDVDIDVTIKLSQYLGD